MAVLRCKMCGGTLALTSDSIATCEYCGTQQTVPAADNEKPQAPHTEPLNAEPSATASTASLLKRAYMFLEDEDWRNANTYCEKVLDLDPECAEAYLGKLLAELKVKHRADLKEQKAPFDSKSSYKKALRFADSALQKELEECSAHITSHNANSRLERFYDRAVELMQAAESEESLRQAATLFAATQDYKDSRALIDSCNAMAETMRKDELLASGKLLAGKNTIHSYCEAIKTLESISGWKDADEQAAACRRQLEAMKLAAEEARIAAQTAWKETHARNKRNQQIISAIVILISVIIALIFLVRVS